MGTYEELKAAVASVIKTNGNQEITGLILQNSLMTLISQIGANATFAGIAMPNTVPGTPDQNIFYLAITPGTYTNFNGEVLKPGRTVVFSNKTGSWVATDLGVSSSRQTMAILGVIDSLSINKINPATITIGSYINGNDTDISEPNFMHTSLIKVTPGRTYSVRVLSENYCTIFGYDINLVQQSTLISNSINNNVATFTVPTNSEYIIINLNKGSLSDEQIRALMYMNEGTSILYQPYNPNSQIELNTIGVDALGYDGQYSFDNPSGNVDNSIIDNVVLQGKGNINTRRFKTLNDNGNIALLRNVYPAKVVANSPISGISAYYLEYEKPTATSFIYPWNGKYKNGSIIRLWTNYNVYTELRVHFGFERINNTNVSEFVSFVPSEIIAGNAKTANGAISQITAKVLQVSNGYCQLEFQCLIKADGNYRADFIVYDFGTGSGSIPGVKYQFFGFEELINKQCSMPLQQFANILPDKINTYDEAIIPGYVQLLKNNIVTPIITNGYTNEQITNPIPDILVNTFNSTKKVSSDIIFPFYYSLVGSKGTVGIWLNKTEYAGTLRLQLSLITSPVRFNFIDVLPADFITGKTFTVTDAYITFTATILATNGDYYFFEINYNAFEAGELQLIPYEQNADAGAVVGKAYTYVGWLGSANPYNNILKYDLTRLQSQGEESRVKLALPDEITFEYNKATQIFKYCINKAFNYKNFNIQVLLDRDVTSGKDYNRYFQYQPQVTGVVNATFQLYDNSRNLLDEKVVKFNVVQRTTQPTTMQTVLFIGDSLTFYNRITDEFYRVLTSNDARTTTPDTLSIYDVVKFAGRNWGNVQLIGTQKQDYLGWVGQTYNEGYSGWDWSNFLKSGSPFFIGGALNFNAYLTNNGFTTPNVIYIGLGWNDQKYVTETSPGVFDVSVVMGNARTFLTALTTQLPNTKVRLWTENVPGTRGGIGNHPYGAVEWADEQRAKLIQIAIAEGYKELIKDFPTVGIVWSTAMIDSENSLQETTAGINTRINNTEVLGKDYVHPADAGFFQIADTLISDFVSLIV